MRVRGVLFSLLVTICSCCTTTVLAGVQTIIQGWRLATAVARKVLADSAEDNGKDEAKFREDLYNIAK